MVVRVESNEDTSSIIHNWANLISAFLWVNDEWVQLKSYLHTDSRKSQLGFKIDVEHDFPFIVKFVAFGGSIATSVINKSDSFQKQPIIIYGSLQ